MNEQYSYGEVFEVSWQTQSSTIHGTLIEPVGPGPFPAVVMVAGSGPTDRDWNSPLLPGSSWLKSSEQWSRFEPTNPPWDSARAIAGGSYQNMNLTSNRRAKISPKHREGKEAPEIC
jgi:hypothetical protein